MNASWEVLPESTLREAVDLLVRLVEAAGAVIIFVGAVWAFGRFLLAGVRGGGGVERQFTRIRLSLGRFLVLGLEFQLAGDVLRTAIAPSFTEIGQLAAIAAIRTALNFFLGREIASERAEIERDGRGEKGKEGAGGSRAAVPS
ncbi:hypothetical protein CUT44_02075 [Streptomyces carminius]|uniref:DUF1622 domain-containing protein n=1 Tax=Streptomyces carminius TaxID=2665496 RepID=A0A2M8M1G9_9ACTN|nr:DUF1622 domain-containing protein [Streptomyces carminius]PJE98051.1 hypothetical protein CUT44_10335 [Streptomyces carminius]PJF01877.1 hypothetical protein CUT44_02075 [Streptomyces carminius]